jgi:hypothetical protein
MGGSKRPVFEINTVAFSASGFIGVSLHRFVNFIVDHLMVKAGVANPTEPWIIYSENIARFGRQTETPSHPNDSPGVMSRRAPRGNIGLDAGGI